MSAAAVHPLLVQALKTARAAVEADSNEKYLKAYKGYRDAVGLFKDAIDVASPSEKIRVAAVVRVNCPLCSCKLL
jgi:MIT (microtubule interacting and transport) domain-containing protein